MQSDKTASPLNSGRLRIALNMGNPILTSSANCPGQPGGLAFDLGRALAERLGVEPVFLEFQTAAQCLNELTSSNADISFMAIDPKRSTEVHFSSPYVEISGAFVVHADSELHTNADVDQAGHEAVVGVGSAYDLFLTRYLKNASLHRIPLSEKVVEEMICGNHTASAGIRQQLEDLVKHEPKARILQEDFMVIQQAIAVSHDRVAGLKQQVEDFLSSAISSGFIRDSLSRHGIPGARIAQGKPQSDSGRA